MRYYQSVQHLITAMLLLVAGLGVLFYTEQQAPPAPLEMVLQETVSAAIPAQAAADGLSASIRLASEGMISLSHAVLLLNGEKVGDFGKGALTIPVSPGDIIQIDGTQYGRLLTFSVEPLSAAIATDYLVSTVSCYEDVVTVGIVVFE